MPADPYRGNDTTLGTVFITATHRDLLLVNEDTSFHCLPWGQLTTAATAQYSEDEP